MSFAVSLVYNFACSNYFNVGRTNILYSACFFLAGGLVYLYRDVILKLNQWIALCITGCTIVFYYIIGGNVLMCLLVSCSLLIYALIKSGGILENRISRFFSNISLEIYLSYMAIFRIVDKLGINRLFGNGWFQYIITVLVVICGTTVFAVVLKKVIGRAAEVDYQLGLFRGNK